MQCPECKEHMEPLCMSGNDEEINIDYHCNKCGTLASLKWNPGKNVPKSQYDCVF